jgi:dienelactone hydrolase
MKTYLTVILCFMFSHNALALCDGAVQKTSIPDPVNTTTFNIEARTYRPPVAPGEKFPIVFILPAIVGETPLDGALALNFCLNGMGAYVLNVLNDPPEGEQVGNLNTHEDTLIRAEVALNQLISNLASDPEVNGRYGIIGASQGAIISSYLSGVVPEISGSVIIAGGGGLANILATSEQESVKSLREKRLAAFNLPDAKAYEDLMTPFITLEPLIVVPQTRPDTALLFVLKKDIDVPTKNQRLLAEAYNRPRVIEINNTHIPGIVEASTLHASRILSFFREKLK